MTYLDKADGVLEKNDPSTKFDTIIAVIPAYNESENIINIITEVKKFVTSIIVIDDGSTDNTYALALSTKVKVIRLNRNRGKGAALKRGIIESVRYNPDVIVTLDADGQHDAQDIPTLLKPIQEGLADIVIGSRYNTLTKQEIPRIRGIGLSIIDILNRTMMKINVRDTQSGFRAYNKSIISTITDYDSVGYGAETEQLAQAEIKGFNIMEVPIKIKYNGLGKTSKMNPLLHGTHLLSTILKIAIEKKPLLIFGLSGFILILISLLPITNLLSIFNETRYFSVPLALIALGLSFIGSLSIVVSFVLYALKRIRHKIDNKYI
jgi:glycosyltransferase involved in cell wall biosynthesis